MTAWQQLTSARALPRSSHSISVIANKAYIFGGEIIPRQPVSNDIYVLDIASGKLDTISSPDAPTPRVGHTSAVIGSDIYIFSGRGGAEMTPIDELGAVHVFHTATSTWSILSTTSAVYPCARSYHCSTSTPSAVIIHAGCGDATMGRLADTWLFSVASREWTRLPDGPGSPRGGSAVAYLDDKIYRFGGFNGKTEVGGAIDVLDISIPALAAWSSIVFGDESGLGCENLVDLAKPSKGGPGPRSVTGLHAIGKRLVLLFGEGKPSPTGGHDAAGNFWDDIWTFDPASASWSELAQGSAQPVERGWFASAPTEDGRVVLSGGIDAKNERLEDVWVLTGL